MGICIKLWKKIGYKKCLLSKTKQRRGINSVCRCGKGHSCNFFLGWQETLIQLKWKCWVPSGWPQFCWQHSEHHGSIQPGRVEPPLNLKETADSRLWSVSLGPPLSFNFVAAITICSDSGAQKNKVWHCFHCFPIYFPWSGGTGCHDLHFLNVEL